MEAKLINIKDYIRSGEGANGSSYDSVTDPLEMVKLYNTDYPIDTIYTELEVARKVYDLGIPSPEPGELVTDGERIGIRFRRIVGKRSHARAVSQEPERLEEFAREFAGMCRRLHSIECPEGTFPNAKEQFRNLVKAEKAYTEEQKRKIYDFIDSVPDCNTALHGDMHFGNTLTTLPKGAPFSDKHDTLFIDLGYFGQGYPLFDLGMTMNICLTADEDFRVENFHINGEQTAKIWEYFVDEYFEGKETVESANAKVYPFMALKMFLVSFNIGSMPAHYDAMIRKAFDL